MKKKISIEQLKKRKVEEYQMQQNANNYKKDVENNYNPSKHANKVFSVR